LGVVTEELSTKGVELAGNLPASLELHQDFSAATLKTAHNRKPRRPSWLYQAPEAADAWRPGGVVTPIP